MARLFGTCLEAGSLNAHFMLAAVALVGLTACNFVSGGPKQGTLSRAVKRDSKEFGEKQ